MEQLIVYLLNANDLYRNDQTGGKLKQALKCMVETFADIGILVDVRFPHDIDTALFDEILVGLGYTYVRLNKSRSASKTGGVFVFYNKDTVSVSNVELNDDIEQIYFDVEGKQNPQHKFKLYAFYLRPINSDVNLTHYQMAESAKIWGPKFADNSLPFFAIGDSNCYFDVDSKKHITDISLCTNSVEVNFRNMVLANKMQQHNTVLNDKGRCIDVCISGPNQPFEISSDEAPHLFESFKKKESHHKPLFFYFDLKK